MKRENLLFMCFVAAVLHTGCTSKREKYEEAVNQVIKEYRIPEFSEDEITRFNNINALAKEYGKEGEFNIFKHEVGNKSDADFERQFSKDSREIAAVSGEGRYKPLYGKELKTTFVCFCDKNDYNYNRTISELQENPSDFDSPDELAAKFKDKISLAIDEDMNVDAFIEYMRQQITSTENHHLEIAQNYSGYKYLAFVHPEYCFPPILVGDDSFEGGIICAHLQLFSIKDKNCLLDKRVFAVNGDKVIVPALNPQDDLEIRLKHEVELQINKCGIPLAEEES